MKKQFAIVSFFLTALFSVCASEFPEKLSEQAKISILSVDYSDISHSLFSKNCLRIYDKETQFDKIIDFAHFDNFDDDFFGLTFFLKNKKARIIIEDFFTYFLKESQNANASITESNVNLNSGEVAYIYSFIKTLHTALPHYQYDFDILTNNSETHISQILHDCYRMAGKNRSDEQYFFSSVTKHSLAYKKIDGSFVLLSEKENVPLVTQDFSQPFCVGQPVLIVILCVISGIVFLFTGYQIFAFFFEKLYRMSIYKTVQIFDFLIFFIAGISGFVIVLQDFFSEQSLLRNNFQFLFLFPLHVIAAFLMFKESIPSKVQIVYWSATSFFSLAYVVIVAIIDQKFPVLTFLLAFPIFLRTAYFDFRAIMEWLRKVRPLHSNRLVFRLKPAHNSDNPANQNHD